MKHFFLVPLLVGLVISSISCGESKIKKSSSKINGSKELSKTKKSDSKEQSKTKTFGELLHVSSKEDLNTKLKDAGNNLVVIDFFAKWCGPCKMISPKIEELAKEYPDVVFLKVDVDECEDIASEFEISSMPTFVFIKSGAKLETFSGANFDKLKETLLKHK